MADQNKMLVIIENQSTVKAFTRFLLDVKPDMKNAWVTLMYVQRKSAKENTSVEEKLATEKLAWGREQLDWLKTELSMSHGVTKKQIETEIDLLEKRNSSVTARVAEKLRHGGYSTVFLSRKYNLSKSAEFALGDVSSRLLRVPLMTNVVVLKTA